MEVKVCGNTRAHDIAALLEAGADWCGLIFVDASPRCIPTEMPVVDGPLVGVFVNPTFEEVREKVARYKLAAVQLHGDETPEFCERITELGVQTWKAIGVETLEDLNATYPYRGVVSRIVLDTKSVARGGSGRKFDWKILDHLPPVFEYMLAGGISPEDAEAIRALPNIVGVDINSRFETSPGIKDIRLVEKFIKAIK